MYIKITIEWEWFLMYITQKWAVYVMNYFMLHLTPLPTDLLHTSHKNGCSMYAFFRCPFRYHCLLNNCYTHHMKSDPLCHETLHVPLSHFASWMICYTCHTKMAVPRFVCVNVTLRHNIIWMIFFTHNTKMEAPQYACTDVFHYDNILLMIPNSHKTECCPLWIFWYICQLQLG
jgi:hypothetical protein